MRHKYRYIEYQEMVRVYNEEVYHNSGEAVRYYQEFSVPKLIQLGIENPRVPCALTMSSVAQRYKKFGTFLKPTYDSPATNPDCHGTKQPRGSRRRRADMAKCYTKAGHVVTDAIALYVRKYPKRKKPTALEMRNSLKYKRNTGDTSSESSYESSYESDELSSSKSSGTSRSSSPVSSHGERNLEYTQEPLEVPQRCEVKQEWPEIFSSDLARTMVEEKAAMESSSTALPEKVKSINTPTIKTAVNDNDIDDDLFVYTTRLDHMVVFTEDLDLLTPKQLNKRICKQSKPKLKAAPAVPYDDELKESLYESFLQKLEEFQRRTRNKKSQTVEEPQNTLEIRNTKAPTEEEPKTEVKSKTFEIKLELEQGISIEPPMIDTDDGGHTQIVKYDMDFKEHMNTFKCEIDIEDTPTVKSENKEYENTLDSKKVKERNAMLLALCKPAKVVLEDLGKVEKPDTRKRPHYEFLDCPKPDQVDYSNVRVNTNNVVLIHNFVSNVTELFCLNDALKIRKYHVVPFKKSSLIAELERVYCNKIEIECRSTKERETIVNEVLLLKDNPGSGMYALQKIFAFVSVRNEKRRRSEFYKKIEQNEHAEYKKELLDRCQNSNELIDQALRFKGSHMKEAPPPATVKSLAFETAPATDAVLTNQCSNESARFTLKKPALYYTHPLYRKRNYSLYTAMSHRIYEVRLDKNDKERTVPNPMLKVLLSKQTKTPTGNPSSSSFGAMQNIINKTVVSSLGQPQNPQSTPLNENYLGKNPDLSMSNVPSNIPFKVYASNAGPSGQLSRAQKAKLSRGGLSKSQPQKILSVKDNVSILHNLPGPSGLSAPHPNPVSLPGPSSSWVQAPQPVNINFDSVPEVFKDLRLSINNVGKVSADLSTPVGELSTAELKFLADVLSNIEKKAREMGLKPGTVITPFAETAFPQKANSQVNDANDIQKIYQKMSMAMQIKHELICEIFGKSPVRVSRKREYKRKFPQTETHNPGKIRVVSPTRLAVPVNSSIPNEKFDKAFGDLEEQLQSYKISAIKSTPNLKFTNLPPTVIKTAPNDSVPCVVPVKSLLEQQLNQYLDYNSASRLNTKTIDLSNKIVQILPKSKAADVEPRNAPVAVVNPMMSNQALSVPQKNEATIQGTPIVHVLQPSILPGPSVPISNPLDPNSLFMLQKDDNAISFVPVVMQGMMQPAMQPRILFLPPAIDKNGQEPEVLVPDTVVPKTADGSIRVTVIDSNSETTKEICEVQDECDTMEDENVIAVVKDEIEVEETVLGA